MAVSVGTRLGPYEITAPIGAGGMGQVWKALDTRLNRTVAIKVANQQFSERFEREARAVAALNHPHICQLYDVGPDYLVMEYVEGRSPAGPLPVDQSLAIALQICAALDAAHRKGIIHRDLKPANILLAKSGVKLLDFGLARQEERQAANPSSTPEQTVTLHLTAPHTILGTPQYMAPEQIEGRDADARTDIFAFGCVLYEMLTGRKAFEGKNPSTAMAAVLATEPPAISSVQPGVAPPALERVVSTCLAKDPDERWQSARELKHALEWAAAAPAPAAAAPASRRAALPWAAAAVLALAIPALWLLRPKPSEPQLVQLELSAPEGTSYTSSNIGRYAVSPDGRRLAFLAAAPDGRRSIFVRRLDATQAARLPGTDGASGPFWAPDSRWLGFIAAGKLFKVDVVGGQPQMLCEAATTAGTWNRAGVILFGSFSTRIQKVSAAGGSPSPVLAFDTARAETGQVAPYFLPDGSHFLYYSVAKQRGIAIGSLDGKSRFLFPNTDSPASFAAGAGSMLFVRGTQLIAQPFDPDRGVLRGDAVPIAEDVSHGPTWSGSDNGVLVFRHSQASDVRLTWFDREGKPQGAIGDTGRVVLPRLSPDQKTIAFAKFDGAANDIWLFDTGRGNSTRLTFDSGNFETWSPDGGSIAYYRRQGSDSAVVERPALGVGKETVLYKGPRPFLPLQISRDGHWLTCWTGSDSGLVLLPLPTGEPVPFPPDSPDSRDGSVSPDGRWFLYSSTPAGRREVFVQTLPGVAGPGKWQISIAGGAQPAWRADGKEIFYLAADGRMMAVPVESGPALRPGVPKPLFLTRLEFDAAARAYDVSADGKRFLLANPVAEGASVPITVILNWPALLKK